MKRAPHLAALAACLACACTHESAAAPRWIALARGFEPAPLLEAARNWQVAAGRDPGACREFYMGVQIVEPLPPEDWQPGTEPGTWSTSLPGGAFAYGATGSGFVRLEAPPLNLPELPAGAPLSVPPQRPGAFRLVNERVELVLAPGKELPAGLQLAQYCENGRRDSDGVWQVRVGSDEFHAGLPVWSGRAARVDCAIPAHARLSFETRFLTRTPSARATLRVRLDGEVVYERADDSARLSGDTWHSFALPPELRAQARLTFELEGPPGQLLVLHPVVGPAELGTPAARPWPAARPDVVLFLADTFRADGLELGGGARELAPNLNRFAEGALRFEHARSNAAWTLPSISTLLTGLAPGQHTANDTGSQLPGELTTLAERLSRAGYRTGAVTDAAFFTPMHGLDQGFESFRMHAPTSWDLDWTVQRGLEFLARDDGRPVFLVVHTYRTHMPYRVGAQEDQGPWNALREAGCKPLATKKTLPQQEWRAQLAACAPRFRELYEQGVKDLDRGFGEFVAGLERIGFGTHGFVLFTSDHGEALGENDDIFHGGPLWDTKLRIPLLVRGPGLGARTVPFGVSLLDVAPTLAGLAGIERDPSWHGDSLFVVADERPLFAFRLQRTTQIALTEGAHKVLAARPEDFESGNPAWASDLERDLHEMHPLMDATWPAELARRRAALVRTLLEPATAAAEAPLNEQQRRELNGLGYGGDDDDAEEDPPDPPHESSR